MDSSWKVIYQYEPVAAETATVIIQPTHKKEGFLARQFGLTLSQIVGFTLIALGLGGLTGPFIPSLRLESTYAFSQLSSALGTRHSALATKPLPASAPVIYTSLVTPEGNSIDPVNREFSLIVPKVGINAPVIANVDPGNPGEYATALKAGVAHASTSFLPNEDGTVYLFSHSTNYDWFVKDLNAVFYLLKNLTEGDLVVLYYKGREYTYRISQKRIVKPSEISYLIPLSGKKSLILQTCWPPGSTAERLLLFADLTK